MATGKKGQSQEDRPVHAMINFQDDFNKGGRVQRKLVAEKGKGQRKDNVPISPHLGGLEQISGQLSGDITSNDALFEILPDVELAMQIMVSSILSPKDLLSSELNYSLDQSVGAEEVRTGVIRIIETFFKSKYPIANKLSTILEDILFKKGSYAFAVLPESSVDELINSGDTVSTESISAHYNACGVPAPLGFLGGNGKDDAISLEDYSRDKITPPQTKIVDFIEVCDNFNILKYPWVDDRKRVDVINNIINVGGIGLEKAVDDNASTEMLYKKRRYKHVPMEIIKAPGEQTGGDAVIMHLPSESVVPVHVPGSPDEHIGFFVLLDSKGHPVSRQATGSAYSELARQAKEAKKTKMDAVVEQARQILDIKPVGDVTTDNISECYTQIIENDLKARLANGVYGDDCELADISAISRIMLSRCLEQKLTRILFIPAELMCYMAFDYNENGTGKTLLDNSRIVSSIRTVLMMSNTMASIRNSIPRTGVKIQLDKDDPQPAESVDFLVTELMKGMQDSLPLWRNNLGDVTHSLQRSSMDIAVSGNTKYPETSVDINDKTRSVAVVDDTIEENMRRRQYMSFGMSPEAIDTNMTVDYATLAVNSNLMMAKRVMLYQDKFCLMLKKLFKIICRYHTPLRNDLEKAIVELKWDDVEGTNHFEKLLDSLTIELPSPDTTKLENQISAFEQYSDALDKALSAYFSVEMLGRVIDSDLEDAIEPTIECLKAYYKRQWLQRNNVLPELESLIETGDPENILKFKSQHMGHVDAILGTVGEFMREVSKKKRKIDDTLEDDQTNHDEKRDNELAAGTDDDDPVIDDGNNDVDPVIDDTTTDDDSNNDVDTVEGGVADVVTDDEL